MATIQTTRSYNWFQRVWNENNRAAIDDLLTDDVIANDLPGSPLIGKDGFKTFFDSFTGGFKDINVELTGVDINDDTETVRCIVTATHIESGTQVKFPGSCKMRFRDGKIAEAWNNFDFETMNQQLAANAT